MGTYQSGVLDIRDFYSRVGLWPSQPDRINPSGWLRNFDNQDLALATHLLDSFLYLNRAQTMRMSESAFHSLSLNIERASSDLPGVAWTKFRRNVLVTYPVAREGNSTASGRLFIRHARESAIVGPHQFFDPELVVSTCSHGAGQPPVVMLDDLAATGDQFASALLKEYVQTNGTKVSLYGRLQEGNIASISYIPTISTASAKQRLQREFPEVLISPAHVLPLNSSACNDPTELEPNGDTELLARFLEKYADRAGYNKKIKYGYRNSGLALAFEHGTPDNTLPIFSAGAVSWRSLIPRQDGLG